MSINKNQFKRLELLHGLLSKKQPVRWSEIDVLYKQHDIIVDKKTIYNDLEALKELFQAPIEKEKTKFFYAKEFSLYELFNVDDVQLASELTALFEQFAHFPIFKGLEEVRLKLKARTATEKHLGLVTFEQNDDYEGLKRLDELYEAIKHKRTLKISYEDFGKPVCIYSISPYMLKEYHNRWHIYGYEHRKEKIYNLALDRIKAIDTSAFPYREQKPDDLAFLQDIIGFTYLYDYRSGTYAPLEEVSIRVALPRANYIKTKPLHPSQQEVVEARTEQHMVFRYHLRFNNELLAKLLEFGKDLEILAPFHLREKMIEQVRMMAHKYGLME